MYNTEQIECSKRRNNDFCKSTNSIYMSKNRDSRLEFLATSFSPNLNRKIVLITLYRHSSTVSTQEFIVLVEQSLSSTALSHAELLVVGDFNDDLMGNTTKISSWFETNGFNQLIDQPTTDQGSLLDHVYFNGVSLIQTKVCDTYYLAHDCTIIAIANTRSKS